MRFFLLTAALCLPGLFAQEGGQHDANMEAMMKAGMPGPEHQMLTKMVGEWKTVNSAWMAPGAEPIKSEGSVKVEAILGGRFVLGWTKGDMMGMPFEGLSITGYDNVTKKFTLSWRSSMDTSTVWGEGTYDEATKTIAFKGKMLSQAMDGSMVDYRFTTKIIDDNHTLDTMYMTMGDVEVKIIEMANERIK